MRWWHSKGKKGSASGGKPVVAVAERVHLRSISQVAQRAADNTLEAIKPQTCAGQDIFWLAAACSSPNPVLLEMPSVPTVFRTPMKNILTGDFREKVPKVIPTTQLLL